MTGRGLTSGGKSSSGYSTQLIRPDSSGSSAWTGDQTGGGAAAAAAGESLRGWRRGEVGETTGTTGNKTCSHLGRSSNYKWMAEHVFFVFFFPLPPCPNLWCQWWDEAETIWCVKPLTARRIMNYASILIAVRREKHCWDLPCDISCLIL